MNTALSNPITEDDIANFLVNTPDFFERHAELLATVQLNSPHNRRTVSLQERQAELLREKIKMLEYRIMEMIRNGNENVILSDKILRWAASLFDVVYPVDLPDIIVEDLKARFSVQQVGLRVWGVADQYVHEPFARGVSEDAKVFANSLMEPYCGLNTGFEASTWLEDPKSAVSMALISLRVTTPLMGSPAFGMLVLASSDATRFSSAHATDFLTRIGEITSAVLARLH